MAERFTAVVLYEYNLQQRKKDDVMSRRNTWTERRRLDEKNCGVEPLPPPANSDLEGHLHDPDHELSHHTYLTSDLLTGRKKNHSVKPDGGGKLCICVLGHKGSGSGSGSDKFFLLLLTASSLLLLSFNLSLRG